MTYWCVFLSIDFCLSSFKLIENHVTFPLSLTTQHFSCYQHIAFMRHSWDNSDALLLTSNCVYIRGHPLFAASGFWQHTSALTGSCRIESLKVLKIYLHLLNPPHPHLEAKTTDVSGFHSCCFFQNIGQLEITLSSLTSFTWQYTFQFLVIILQLETSFLFTIE